MVTLRELCLLHQRDANPAPSPPLYEIFSGDQTAPLNWGSLATLLRAGDSYRQWIDPFLAKGRLTGEQAAFAWSAFDFLDDRKEHTPQGLTISIYDSIWDVVWDYSFLDEGDRYIFRGQVDSRWPLTPSLFRAVGGSAPDLATLVARIESTETFVQALRERAPELIGHDLNDEELLAIAQHYGFPSTLLDFTRSLRVAAFFATHGASRLSEEAIGIIYYMRGTRDELAADGSIAERLTLGDFSLLEAARIHIGDLHVVEPELKDTDNRIARQRGLFLAGYEVHDLQQVTIDRLRFRQTGETFEDSALGIAASVLLPADSPLQRLTNDTHQRTAGRRRRVLNAGVASARLPINPIVGSDGAHLFTQLRLARDFFDELRTRADSKRLHDLGVIFDEYFGASRVNADVGEALEPTSSQPAVIPIAVAVSRLAELTGSDGDRLWATVFGALKPGPLDDVLGAPRVKPLEPATAEQQLAVSCSLFLAAWEQLQHVNGAAAQQLMLNARLTLRGSSSLPSL